MPEFLASLKFLQRLPTRRALALEAPRTLLGIQHLTNLNRVDVIASQQLCLDPLALASLPNLQQLFVQLDCKASELLESISFLRIGEAKYDPEIALLTGLKAFRTEDDNTLNIQSHASTVSSHTTLTALNDNRLCKDSWNLLPHLQVLDVYSSFLLLTQDVQ